MTAKNNSIKSKHLFSAAVIIGLLYLSGNFVFNTIEARFSRPVTFTCEIPRELPDYFPEMFGLENNLVKITDGLEQGVFMASELNGWTPLDDNSRMERRDTYLYTLTVTPPPGKFEYKYTFLQKDGNGEHVVWIHDLSNVNTASSGVYFGKSLNSIYHRRTVIPYQTFMNTLFRYLFIILVILIVSSRVISFIFLRAISLKYKFYFSFLVTSLIVIVFGFFIYVNQIVDQIKINWMNQAKLLYRMLAADDCDILDLKTRADTEPIFLSGIYRERHIANLLLNYNLDAGNQHTLEIGAYYLIDEQGDLIAAGATQLGSNQLETEPIIISRYLNDMAAGVGKDKGFLTGLPNDIVFFNGYQQTDQHPILARWQTVMTEYRLLGPRRFFFQVCNGKYPQLLWYLFHPYFAIYYPINEHAKLQGALVAFYSTAAFMNYLQVKLTYYCYTSFSILIAILILSIILIEPILLVINKLTGRFQEVSRGEYGNRITIETRDELQSMGEAFNSMLDGLRAKQQLLHYVSKSAWEQAHKRAEGDETAMLGESKSVTLLFSDIKGFTPLANRYSAREVVEILNEYFDAMTKIISRHGGQIDKFIGDAIMAVFEGGGDADGCGHAVQAAIAMQQFLKDRVLAGKESIQIRIGINTGQVIMGDIGSLESRRDYTCIGDNVNKTQRLESLCAPGCILLSTESYLQIS